MSVVGCSLNSRQSSVTSTSTFVDILTSMSAPRERRHILAVKRPKRRVAHSVAARSSRRSSVSTFPDPLEPRESARIDLPGPSPLAIQGTPTRFCIGPLFNRLE